MIYKCLSRHDLSSAGYLVGVHNTEYIVSNQESGGNVTKLPTIAAKSHQYHRSLKDANASRRSERSSIVRQSFHALSVIVRVHDQEKMTNSNKVDKESEDVMNIIQNVTRCVQVIPPTILEKVPSLFA